MRRRWPLTLALIALALLFVVPSGAAYYTDWLWFRELGYERVFLRTLNAQARVFVVTLATVFIFLFINFLVARAALRRPQIVVTPGRERPAMPLAGRQLTGFALPGAAVLALVFAISSANNWLDWLTFFNAGSFGIRDPLLGHDLSFYIFRLPIWQSIR